MSKYHNRKIEADGYVFDSLAEHRRYCQLRLLLGNGDISQLEVHPRYPLVVNGHKIGTYIADFRYCDRGQRVTEDVKGVRTAAYVLKKKLMAAIHGIDITEIEA